MLVVVQMGEWLQLLTCGAYPACMHQVQGCQPGRNRISCPLLQRETRGQVLDTTTLKAEASQNEVWQLEEPMEIDAISRLWTDPIFTMNNPDFFGANQSSRIK